MATPVVVGQAYRLSFTIKSYDKEGDFSDSQNSSTGNPLATIAYLNKNIRDDRVTGNAHLTWEVIEDLSFRISFGIDLLNRREWIFRYEFYVYSTYQKLAFAAIQTLKSPGSGPYSIFKLYIEIVSGVIKNSTFRVSPAFNANF